MERREVIVRGNILLVFDDFDPISNYKLRLVDEALKVEASINSVIFLYEAFKGDVDRVFQSEEKLALLSASLPNKPMPCYVIDGSSFSDSSLSISRKIQDQINKYKQASVFLLLDSREYQILEQSNDWPYILNTTTIILYVRPEDKEWVNTYSVTSKSLLFINTSKELNELSRASIFEVTKEAFNPVLIDYMNKSGECAIKRIKAHLTPERFRHSLRVAGTIKKICEVLEIEDEEFCYDAYLSGIYHDICKEIPMDMQEAIAKDMLGLEGYSSWKELHAPIGAWYLKNKYLFSNEEIIEAVAQHTTPSEDPKLITVCLYLADKLEVGKKDRYKEEIYEMVWGLISDKKPMDAFSFLVGHVADLKKASRD